MHQLEPSVALRRFPVRQADFFVLQAPDVPSVLVELGFLSNADDIANLQQGDWQDRTVDALARGIADYFDGAADADDVHVTNSRHVGRGCATRADWRACDPLSRRLSAMIPHAYPRWRRARRAGCAVLQGLTI